MVSSPIYLSFVTFPDIYIYTNQPTRVIFLAKVPHVLGPKLPFVDKVSGMVTKPMMRVIR